MLNVLNVFLYGFITLITLISVANIFNTVSTSISLRTREFAMLRSVGMTKQSLNRMLRFESMFYGMKALIWGIPISILIEFLMYGGLSRNFSFGFYLPVVPLVIVVLAHLCDCGAYHAVFRVESKKKRTSSQSLRRKIYRNLLWGEKASKGSGGSL